MVKNVVTKKLMLFILMVLHTMKALARIKQLRMEERGIKKAVSVITREVLKSLVVLVQLVLKRLANTKYSI